jgi:hypothetical protein
MSKWLPLFIALTLADIPAFAVAEPVEEELEKTHPNWVLRGHFYVPQTLVSSFDKQVKPEVDDSFSYPIFNPLTDIRMHYEPAMRPFAIIAD